MLLKSEITIDGSRPCLLMLDYDGTLSPIAEHFDQARITPENLAFLRQLAHLPSVQLAIVSGRSVAQLREFLKGLEGLPVLLVGLHGGEVFDLETQAFLEEPAEDYLIAVAALKEYLIEHGIGQLSGVELEDKGHSLGVHYRQAADADAEQALCLLRQGHHELGLHVKFKLRPGKKLLEAVPEGFNKGVGVTHLLPLMQKRFAGEDPCLLYVGDDITDFDAFRIVNAHQGYSVFVGSQLPAEAPEVALILPDVPSVYRFLEKSILTAVNRV